MVAARRAALLVLQGKADTVSKSKNLLRSEHLVLEVPSVIRLRYFVNIPYVKPNSISRKSIFARDRHICQYCGQRAESIDHVVPKSRGGKHIWENVVAACKRCNTTKRDHLLSETSLMLISSPKIPGHFTRLVLSVGEVPKNWKPYLANSV